jgi:hypothetical protein
MTTNKLIKTIVNCETGEIVKREYTADEYEQYEADQLANAQLEAEAQAKATAKAALLTQLGITEEQAKLLLS